MDWTTLRQKFTYRPHPDDGVLEFDLDFVPDSEVTDFEVEYDTETVSVISSEGLTKGAEGTLGWDGSPEPSAQCTYDFTRDTDLLGRPVGVETADWLFTVTPYPVTKLSWLSGEGQWVYEHDVNQNTTGISGDRMVFLGEFDQATTEVKDERIRLVVPDATDIQTEMDGLIKGLGEVARSLAVGGRAVEADAKSVLKGTHGVEVTAFAVPDPMNGGGLASGNDFYVHEMSGTEVSAGSTWAHEYVHTRQTYRTEPSLQWTIEGGADYYAAMVPWQMGNATYASVTDELARGTGDSAVLADPETWNSRTDYQKGSLVIAALDAEIQTATDGQESFQTVFETLNGEDEVTTGTFQARCRHEQELTTASVDSDTDPVITVNNEQEIGTEDVSTSSQTGEDFKSAAESVAGIDLTAFFDAYIEGPETPEVPVHTAFPATMDYHDTDATLEIQKPTDGATVETPTQITVSVEVKDFTLEPASNGIRPHHGHLHVLLDSSPVPAGEEIPSSDSIIPLPDGSDTAEIEIPKGTETVAVQASDASGVAYDLIDEVTIEPPVADMTAQRQIDATTLSVGESATVTVDIDLSSSVTELTLTEVVDSTVSVDITVQDDGNATDVAVDDDADELSATWNDVDQVTFTYTVKPMVSLGDGGKELSFSGAVSINEQTEPIPDKTITLDGNVTGVVLNSKELSIAPNEQGAIEVLLGGIDGEVGSYSVTVSTNDPSVASLVGIEHVGDPSADSGVTDKGGTALAAADLGGTSFDASSKAVAAELIIEGGAEGTAEFTITDTTLTAPDGTVLGIDIVEGTTLTVSAEPTLADYTDENGVAQATDVFAAIDDWRSGDIDPNLVFSVIDAWRSG